jgi:hypothetical protein
MINAAKDGQLRDGQRPSPIGRPMTLATTFNKNPPHSSSSPRASITSRTHHACNQDAFLADWIDRQLGDKTYRPVFLMQVRLTGPGSRDEHGEIIQRAGGLMARRSGREVIGVWGISDISQADPSRVIALAIHLHELSNAGVQCMMHGDIIAVSKAAEAVAHDEILSTLAELLMDAAMLEEARHAVIISETFRTMSGLRHGFLPISIASSQAATDAPALYMLVNQHKNADAALRLTCSGPVARAAQLDALGDFKPLAQAAAIASPPFTLELLARMLELDPSRLQPALDAACAHNLFIVQETRHSAHCTFRDEQLQCAAYDTVPDDDRLRLQRKDAKALRKPNSNNLPGGPAAIARRHQSACDATQSKRWFSKAAWQEIVEGSASEAVDLLHKSLAQHDNANGRTTAFNRALLQLLGVQLAVTRSNAADPVFDAYLQSR